VINDAQRKVSYLDNISTYIAVGEFNGDMVFSSKVTLDSLGLTVKDIEGTKFEDMLWWEYSTDMKNRMKQVASGAAAGQSSVFEVDIKMGDGIFPIN